MNTEATIRPIPKKGCGRPSKYYLDILNIGECKSFPIHLAQLIRMSASRTGLRNYKKFECRQETTESGEKVITVWRTA